MTPLPRVPLWAGRTLALVGIVLVSINLRSAATSLSAVVDLVAVDIPLDALALGTVGMLPPLLFALAGIGGPRMARRLGLERFLILSMVAMVAGLAVRAVASEYWALFLGSLVALAAAGIGNILLPPIVKRYFPDRIGLLTSIYASCLALGTTVPPAFAVPIANVGGWRVSLGVWAVLALASLPPWIILLLRNRRVALRTAALVAVDEAPEVDEPDAKMVGRVWHSRVAWSLAIVFSLGSVQAYSLFAWLPKLLVEHVGVSDFEGGVLLGYWGILGMGASLIAPILATRLNNVGWILHIGAAGFMIGYLGLLVAPEVSPWLWITACGFGQLIFPAALALINLRTRTHDGAIAVSGFVQGIGYLLAALGPLAVGLLHDATGGWEGSLTLLTATAAILVYFGFTLKRPRFVEDETAGILGNRAAR